MCRCRRSTGRAQTNPRSDVRIALWWLAGGVFVILATANAAGYRYGVSDQAFYIPVVTRALVTDTGDSQIEARSRIIDEPFCP